MELRQIVVGADGTPDSDAALLWAVDEAVRDQGRLLIVHAWGTRTETRAPYARYSPRDDLASELSSATAVLERVTGLAREAGPDLQVESRLVRGRPETALPHAAHGADLLVLGSAAQRAGDGRLGAVLLSCLRRQPCPVVVVDALTHAARQRMPVGSARSR
ncbi:universal stress protein [Nonomuraea glycinis]|uniref:universal stress protein n=1 Tax=Nonomuraea glycinis TaxID=2047744 RepID=UPI002E113BAC|nr:universal stress protein [Nonomuraea glycinis]